MRRILTVVLAVSVALLSACAAMAQQGTPAQTVSACGTLINSPVVGNFYSITQDPTGHLCTNASSSGGGGSAPFQPSNAPNTTTLNVSNVANNATITPGVSPTSTSIRLINTGSKTAYYRLNFGAVNAVTTDTPLAAGAVTYLTFGSYTSISAITAGADTTTLVYTVGVGGVGGDGGGSGTGGGGGAVTMASSAVSAGAYVVGSLVDGADSTEGTKADAAYNGSGSTTVVGALKGLYTAAVAPLPAQSSHGVNIGGVEGLAASGASVTGNPVLTGGSDGSNARSFSTDSSGNQNVNMRASAAGASTAMVTCTSHISGHISSATDTFLIQGVTSQIIKICGFQMHYAGTAAQAVFLENTASTNANCTSTKTQIAGTSTGNSTTPASDGFYNAFWGGLANTVSNGLCLNSTGTGGADYDLWYTQGS